VLIETSTPCRASICKQDVDMIRMLRNFLDQPLDLGDLTAVGRDRDGNRAWSFIWKGVQSGASFLAGSCFAGCDEDF
jgi:hypothetical protein